MALGPQCASMKPCHLVQVGYLGGNDPGLHLLSFWLPENGEERDGRWSCSSQEDSLPALQHSLMHPCAGGGSSCCGLDAAPIVTRFNSYFASKQAVLIMAYEVWPICGDGIDMEISLTSKGAPACAFIAWLLSAAALALTCRHMTNAFEGTGHCICGVHGLSS